MTHKAALLVLGAALGCAPARLVAPLRVEIAQVPPDDPRRAIEPALAQVTEVVAPPPRVVTLPNGLRVVLVPRPGVSLVESRLVVERGAVDVDDAGDVAVSEMVDLFGRTGDARRLDDLVALAGRLQASWGLDHSPDALVVTVHVPSAYFEESLELVARGFVDARLSQEEYDRVRAERQRLIAFDPVSLQAGVRRVLFGSKSAYGHAQPNPVSTLEGAQALHDRLVQPAHSTLLVVGDVTPERVDQAVARWLGAWTNRAPIPQVTARPPEGHGPRVALLHAATQQVKVAVFARGPEPSSDDTVALDVASEVLDGVASDLWGSLRESGDAYMSGAGVTRARTATFVAVLGSFQRERALDGTRRTLDAAANLCAGRVADADIASAREAVLAAWRHRMSTVRGAAAQYAASLEVGLDRVRDYPDRVRRVTGADVARVTCAYLSPSSLHVLFMGPTDALNADSLEMGPPVTLHLGRR